MSTVKAPGNNFSGNIDNGIVVYDLVCGGELGPGVLPGDVALYLLGQVGQKTLSGGLVRFSGSALDGICETERTLFAGVATIMGASECSVATGAEPDGTAVVEYDLTRLEPLLWDGDAVRTVADAERPFVSVGYVGDLEGAAVDAVKHILAGREVYYDCTLFGVPPDLAAAAGLGGNHRPGSLEPTETGFPVVVTTIKAGRAFQNSDVKVYVASAATVAASVLTGRLEDPTRLFRKEGRR